MRFGRSKGGGRRISSRQPAPVLATFFTLSRTARAIVTDVSESGVRLNADSPPDQGEEVILSLDGLRTYGTVIWVNGRECGIAFDEPLPASWIEALRLIVTKGRGLPPQINAALNDWTIRIPR
jgi:hypothetical protein